jgi:hypothetical protein
MEQINFTNFVKLPMLITPSDVTPLQTLRVDIQINPINVMYFYPSTVTNEKDEKWEVVTICVGARLFTIDLTITEFEKIWDEVKRGFEVGD